MSVSNGKTSGPAGGGMPCTPPPAARLRSLLAELRSESRLLEVDWTVNPVHEMASHVEAARGWPVLFTRVQDASFPILYNLFGDPRWVAKRLGTSPEGIVDALLRAYRSARDPVPVTSRHTRIASSPIQLRKLVPMGRDQARQRVPCLNAGIIIVRDPDTGLQNTSMHTLNLIADNKLVIHVQSTHFAEICGAWQKRRRPMPMAVALGVDPTIWLACGLTIEHPPEELAVAGGIASAVELARCELSDLAVPAMAEIVLEGFVEPGERGPGGPEPIPSFQYGQPYHGPVFTVHRVSAFEDGVAHGLVNAGQDHQNQLAWLKEFSVVRHLEDTGVRKKIHALKVNPSGQDWLCCAMSIAPEHKAEAPEIARSLLNADIAIAGLRRVVVVDTDVDVSDGAAVDWAVRTRMRPHLDLIVEPPRRRRGPEPILRDGPYSSVAMIALSPAGREEAYVRAAIHRTGDVRLESPPVDSPSRRAQLLTP